MKQIFNTINAFKEEYVELFPPISDEEIKQLETILNVNLPNDFLTFLKFSNGIAIAGDEVLGFGNKNNDLIAVYEREHNEVQYPMFEYIIPFAPDGGGNFYCFDKNNNNIVFWVSNYQYTDNDKPEIVYKSFKMWFQEVMIDWVIKSNGENLFYK
ncbi:SMI1/KNR4 family protein [Capnocytophaga canimorsus]|uniref:SMI1/KNR4 family protein n=1 Tax=Capnocytophaga canimorsus TaxID=28188 RepID=UPI0037D64BB8